VQLEPVSVDQANSDEWHGRPSNPLTPHTFSDCRASVIESRGELIRCLGRTRGFSAIFWEKQPLRASPSPLVTTLALAKLANFQYQIPPTKYGAIRNKTDRLRGAKAH
jgi:hypothetical protein